jgi:hypothetical protein
VMGAMGVVRAGRAGGLAVQADWRCRGARLFTTLAETCLLLFFLF